MIVFTAIGVVVSVLGAIWLLVEIGGFALKRVLSIFQFKRAFWKWLWQVEIPRRTKAKEGRHSDDQS